jgi:hypothetical protein
MGQPWTAYYSSWSPPGTFAFRTQYFGLRAQRSTNSPVARGTTKYINQSGSGSGIGGGGNGSLATPWLVRHGADLKTLIEATNTANTAFLLRAGDLFDASGGTFNIHMVTANQTVAAYGSGNAPVVSGFAPLLGPFTTNEGSGAYTITIVGTAISRVRLNEAAATNLEQGTENVFIRCTSKAQVQANTYAFFADIFSSPGNTVLTVKANGVDLSAVTNLVQTTANTGKGFNIDQADGCRLNGLTIMGFGCEDGNGANGPVWFDIGSGKEGVVSNCNLFYGGKHVGTQNNSGATYGIVSWLGCKVGLFRNPTSGPDTVGQAEENTQGESAAVASFNGIGTHEFIQELDGLYGTLPNYVGATLQPFRRGIVGLAHNAGSYGVITNITAASPSVISSTAHGLSNGDTIQIGGSNCSPTIDGTRVVANVTANTFTVGVNTGGGTIGAWTKYGHSLGFQWGIRGRNHTYGVKSPSIISCAPATMSYHADLANCRSFQIDERLDGGTGTNLIGGAELFFSVRLNGILKSRLPSTTGAFTANFMGSGPRRGCAINTTYQVDHQDIPTGFGFYFSYPAAPSELVDPLLFVHCHIDLKGANSAGAINQYVAWEAQDTAGGNWRRHRWFNSILSIERSQAPQAQNFAPNQAPGTETLDLCTGGMKNCAFYLADNAVGTMTKTNSGVPPGAGTNWGVDLTTAPVFLSSYPVQGAMPTLANGLKGAGSLVLPFTLEHDQNWNPVSRTSADIGPIQNPPGSAEGFFGIASGILN